MAQKKEQYYLGNKNLPKPEIPFEWTPEMIKEIAKCKDDILHFAENYFYIVSLDEGKIKIKLHDCQKRVLKSLMDNRFVVLLASRQVGKTTLFTIYSLWIACFNDDKRALIVANKEDTAINILKRIRLAYEMLPNWLKPGVSEFGKTAIALANGSSIGISTTSSDAGRGDSVSTLLLDEISFIPKHLADQFWSAVYPIISSSLKSKVFAASTPNGTTGLFHSLYTGAIRGENNWKAERIDWHEIPNRTTRWKDDTIKALGSEEKFRVEFGCEFLDLGEAVTSDTDIDTLKLTCKTPKHILEEGAYHVWDEPQKGKVYAAGVDVAEGVGRNSSCIQILDFTDLKNIIQVAEYNSNTVAPAIFTQKINEIMGHWGNPPVLVERNNHGTLVCDNLKILFKYQNVVTYAPSTGKQKFDRIGIYSHTNTKYKGITNMRYWLNEKRAVRIQNIKLINEMTTFVRHETGTWSAKDGYQDDRIMSLCWGLFVLEPGICEKYFEILERDSNGKPAKIIPLHQSNVFNNPFGQEDSDNYAPMVFWNGQGEEVGEIDDLIGQGWRMV